MKSYTAIWDNFLRLRFLDNSVRALLIAAGIILLAFIVRKIISKVIASVVMRLLTKKTRELYKGSFQKEIIKPLSRFIFWIIALTAIEQLRTPDELKYTIVLRRSIHLWMLSISSLIMIATFVRLLVGLSRFLVSVWKHNTKARGDKAVFQLLSIVGDLMDVVLILIGFLTILRIAFKIDISGFVTNLSLVTAALALAAKESLENLIASFIIFLDKPFYVGDYVKVVNVAGTIESIGLRSTRIRTQDKSLITVPNKQMVDSVLDNVTYGTHRRFVETLEFSLTTTPKQLTDLIAQIAQLLSDSKDMGVQNHIVYFKQTGTAAHIIYFEYLVSAVDKPTLYQYYDVNSIINTKILEIVDAAHIEFAQSSTTVVNIQQKGSNGTEVD